MILILAILETMPPRTKFPSVGVDGNPLPLPSANPASEAEKSVYEEEETESEEQMISDNEGSEGEEEDRASEEEGASGEDGDEHLVCNFKLGE